MVMAFLLYRFGNWRGAHAMDIAPEAHPPAAALSTEAGPPGTPTAGQAPPLQE